MRNTEIDTLFYHLTSGMEKSMQAALNMMYTKSKLIDEYNHRKEMEQLKKEIADDVLSRISATVDVTEIVEQIEDLRRAIDSLGN